MTQRIEAEKLEVNSGENKENNRFFCPRVLVLTQKIPVLKNYPTKDEKTETTEKGR